MTADHQTLFRKWEQNHVSFLQMHILKQLQRFSSLTWCETNTNSELFRHWYLPETNIFSKYQVFSDRRTQKQFKFSSTAKRGALIFSSGISVPLL